MPRFDDSNRACLLIFLQRNVQICIVDRSLAVLSAQDAFALHFLPYRLTDWYTIAYVEGAPIDFFDLLGALAGNSVQIAIEDLETDCLAYISAEEIGKLQFVGAASTHKVEADQDPFRTTSGRLPNIFSTNNVSRIVSDEILGLTKC